ncbi:MAG: flavodoxin-dependent (E)-4-hydroxy-3-methylbut-2-enyl-diphosphate synthase [Clostridiales bacterium]|nr:flavodoxin-dependent (E)-4-hydroxy-3-methylbut-2-enyl-diphosphate synthase [Clostridiales bacterium]
MENYKTKKVNIGGVVVGGGERVKIQSMCTVKTSHTDECAAQINALKDTGCDIVRVSVLDEGDARAIKILKDSSSLPVVADIHFSHKLAVAAIESGCDKVRINPGNIGGEAEIKIVADCIKAHKIPVRVGANTGSIEKGFLQKYGKSAEALVESALFNVKILEKCGVNDIVVAVKASDAKLTYDAYTLLAKRCAHPLHIGVTEAGTREMAVVKSSAALGALLLNGIGDTVRISITGDPVEEVYAAKTLLRAVGLDKNFVNVISCPTCGRCRWDTVALADKVNERVRDIKKPLKVAVMGCVVNGPGEAKDCDLGIAGSAEYCVIFKNGEIIRRVPVRDAESEFFKELNGILND